MIKPVILLTGAKGQLGSELQTAAKDFADRFSFIFTDVEELDICDSAAVDEFFNTHSVHYIINCAAYTAVDKAEANSQICEKINTLAPALLAAAAKKHNIKIVHISTDYVFDGNEDTPYCETVAPNPQTVYGDTKYRGELAVFDNCPQSIVIRTAWLYSVFGSNFVKTILRLAKERSELKVVADQKGTPTYCADLAAAILHIIDYSENYDFEAGVYHYSNLGETTWFDFTVEILRQADIDTCRVLPISTEEFPTAAKRPQYSVLDKTKIINTFQLAVPRWEASLGRCIDLLKLKGEL